MSSKFTIKRNDTSPVIEYTFEPVTDLTGASVVFNMRRKNGGVVVNRANATIVSPPTDGTVRYAWQSGDTAIAGLFEAEFEVTYPGGAVETFPNRDYIIVSIAEDVG